MRHTTSYKFQNIIVFAHQFFNDKKIKTDTLNIFLAEEGGRWLGKGKGGIKELDYTYKNNTIYRKGKHSFEVELVEIVVVVNVIVVGNVVVVIDDIKLLYWLLMDF